MKIRTSTSSATWMVTRLALVSLLSVGFIACGDDEEAPNNTSDTGMPDMGTPDASEPDADMPDADMPDMDSPDTDMPDMDSPDTDMPDMDSPDTDMPDMDSPDTDMPDMDSPDAEASLYEQLGGAAAVEAVVGKFLEKVVADERINWFFANTDAANLSRLLQEQICAATGGPCTYTGRTMLEAHEGMAITDAQFDALVEDLLLALDELGVPYSEGLDGSETIDPLLNALLGMRGDIVEDADGDTVLFNQLGGYAAVQAVIDGLITNVGADARINGFFADTDLDNLNRLLVEQVCEATGGFCVYTGRSMRESHAGLNIQDTDFDALVEDLLAALDSLGVAYTADTFDGGLPADALITTLAGLRSDIVNVPAP